MHQTSSRLLRMTGDDRPYTRDFKDLFSTLMVSLPLSSHRIRFKAYPFTFTSEEAINNLGSLKFSQSNRMPDPKDHTRIVTTTTTTTFSMAKEMARSVCQRFMDARFIELADGKTTNFFNPKGSLWQLTPKGIHVLERFCQRNGIQQDHVIKLLQSSYNTMRLVILERDSKTDRLSQDKTTTEVIFRRFAGATPNIKPNVSISDSDSVSEYHDGITGVKLAESRKIYDKVVKNSFTGKCAVDWLLDCCTTVERNETHEILNLFIQYGLIQPVLEDKVYIQSNPKSKDFQPTKNAIYVFTDKGKRVSGWIDGDRLSLQNGDRGSGGNSLTGDTDQRETATTRLTCILNDAALRLLFREYLRETLCEENLSFWLDVEDFNRNFHAIDKSKPDAVRETLAAAYGLYNAFLAPGSPCELNIDHTLRQDMASRMTRAVAKDDQAMYSSLKEVAALFDRAQQQVFKLMAGDSVPKFIRTQKYIEVAGDILEDERNGHNSSIERSQSRRYNNGTAS
ncbi:RGS-domain-containing protein [Choiromyces venosus 120613-1]|uniref:RGS-domain-containing protein n=1 Tax=Choiromyces venosus 120613-1 TaxID=1336337 RepID=A0A3N4JAN9_9PEZI|nr:RGS-domain-containing protein [Choiromyces venosus 120613-1]